MEEKIFEQINRKSTEFAVKVAKRKNLERKRNKVYNLASHLMFVAAGVNLLGFFQYIEYQNYAKIALSAFFVISFSLLGKGFER